MQTGDLLDSAWRLEAPLGDGFLGQTWKARAEEGGAGVIVKALRVAGGTDWKTIDLFRREADALRAITHPDIPRHLASFEHHDADGYWLVLVREFVPGDDLRSITAGGSRFTEEEIIGIFLRLIGILRYLHSLRPPVIHRDVNPKNIIRRGDGSIALVDFSGAQDAVRLASARSATMIGSAGYTPMEQFEGRATTKSDLYGAAATVLFLLSQREPADFPVKDMKIDFAPMIEANPRLSYVLSNWLEADADKRTLSETEALAMLRGETKIPERVDLPATGETATVATGVAASLPMASRIRFSESDGSLTIAIPANAAPNGLGPLAGFAFVWLAFIAFWTYFSIIMGAPIIFPLFSIPFWMIGFFMLSSILKLAFGTTEIRMDREDGFIFREKLFFRTKVTRVPLSELDRCVLEKTGFGTAGSEPKRCRITAGVKRLSFGSNLTDRELSWLAGRINGFRG